MVVADGNPLVDLRRALCELEMRGIGAQGVVQSSREFGLYASQMM